LLVQLQGLETTSDDATNAETLYVRVVDADNGGRLRKVCDFVEKKFREAHLLEEQRGGVKLHIPIMNTKWRTTDKEQADDHSKKTADTFDATAILKQYKDHSFGKFKIAGMLLSEFDVHGGSLRNEAAVTFP